MTLRRLLRRATYLLRLRRREDDLVEELEFHRALTRQRLEARGLDPTTARFEAQRAMGGVLVARERARDVWVWPWLQSIAQDLRFAVRLLVNERRFTIVAVTALALGIGVNSMFFTIVNALCLRGLPIDEVDRVVAIGTRDARHRLQGLSYRDFDDLRAASTTLSGVAAWSVTTLAVSDDEPAVALADRTRLERGGAGSGAGGGTGAGSGGGGGGRGDVARSQGRAPERVQAGFVSVNTFRLIRESPRFGRDFDPADDRPDAAPIVLLGHTLWQGHYGGDPGVIGRTMRVGGTPATIVGVMPRGVKFPGADLWLPLGQMKGLDARRDVRTLTVLGRLANGATVAQTDGEANAIAARLAQQFPETNAGIRAEVVPINDRYNSPVTQPAWIAFITVGSLLVAIACANVANLLLMRTARRAREIAIRVALGATRRRIVRQLLIEGLLLATLGGVAGAWVSILAARLFQSATPEGGLPYWVELTMDARVFGVLAAVCLGTVLVFALAPALHASKADANDVLKEAGRAGSSGVHARRWTAAFLTCEFALTMVLLTAVVDMTRAFLVQERADLVIDTSHLLTMWVAPTGERYATPEARLAFYRRLDERLGVIASVRSASLATALPFSGAPTRQLAIDGRQDPTGAAAPSVWTVAVGPRYFETVGVALRRGRAFTADDGAPGHANAIVNQRFAELHFPNEEVIGRRIRLVTPGGAGAAGVAGASGGGATRATGAGAAGTSASAGASRTAGASGGSGGQGGSPASGASVSASRSTTSATPASGARVAGVSAASARGAATSTMSTTSTTATTATTATASPAAPASLSWLTIVGVSPNIRQRGGIDPDPVVYLPLHGDPPATAALLVRARGAGGADSSSGALGGGGGAGAGGEAEVSGLTSLLRNEVRALDPDLPVYRVRTMDQVISESRWNPRLSRWLVTAVSCIALALAAVGLYAVTAHAVSLRTQEIGVRLALGASAAHVRWTVLRRAMMPLLAGLIVGAICTRGFERLGTGTGPFEPRLTTLPILLPVIAILVIVALAACLAPARRAARLDPVTALRHD